MKCENCGCEHDGSYGSGRFCSTKCSRGFSTKAKRKEINEKVSKTLTKEPYRKQCPECKKIFYTKLKRKVYCDNTCSAQDRIKNPEFIKKLSIIAKKRCSTLEERKRLRDIGRKGGFGKRGITKGGTRYESLVEKEIFEYLEDNNILFEPHKNIPNSSKVSDVYLIKEDLWIEIDGINREKRKKWLGKNYGYWLEKLELYDKLDLKYKIVYSIKDLKLWQN